VHAARSGAHLLQLAHPTLLPPGLLLELAGAVDLLRLRLVEPPELVDHGAAGRAREVVARIGGDGERRAEDPDLELRVAEVLPADVPGGESADEPALHRDQSARGGAHHQAAVGQREQAMLDGVTLEPLAGNEQRLQGIQAGEVGRWLGGRGTHRGSLS
jgi:hypothetical protein